MIDKKTKKLHQENRKFKFWFTNVKENQYLDHSTEFLRRLFHSNDEFPRGS